MLNSVHAHIFGHKFEAIANSGGVLSCFSKVFPSLGTGVACPRERSETTPYPTPSSTNRATSSGQILFNSPTAFPLQGALTFVGQRN